jgi:hypothetical protein
VNGLGRILRFGFFFALMHMASMPVSAADDAAVERGKAWLAAQVESDGSLRQEATSIATALQARSETLQTQAQLAGAASVLVDAVRDDASTTTEFVARRAISLGAAGAQVDGLVAALRRNAVAGSGFGAEEGHPANPLDTAFALVGLRSAGAARDTTIAQALGYLAGAAAADGGYGEGQRPYATAYALLALQRWRADYDLSAAVTRTRTKPAAPTRTRWRTPWRRSRCRRPAPRPTRPARSPRCAARRLTTAAGPRIRISPRWRCARSRGAWTCRRRAAPCCLAR